MSKSNHQKATVPSCQCGCGATTKGGRFLPGHDAKLKSSLVEAALSGSKRAANKLEALGWTKFLDAARARQTPKGAGEGAPVLSGEKLRRKKEPVPYEGEAQVGCETGQKVATQGDGEIDEAS